MNRSATMALLRGSIFAIFLAYWAMICTLTHIPADFAAKPSIDDKLAHFLGYGAFAGLFYLCLWVWRPAFTWTWTVVLAAAMIYGIADELTQPYFHRTADFGDWTADAAGGAVAVVIMAIVQRAVTCYTSPSTPARASL